MKKAAFLSVILLTMLLSMSNKRGRANVSGEGNTGAPGDKTYFCSNCHSSGSYDINAVISIRDSNDMEVTNYLPGRQYQVRMQVNTLTGQTPNVYGFQLVGLKGADNSDLNAFTNPGQNAQITAKNSRHYLEHSNPSTNNFFTATWTAPAAGTGAVTFYAAAIGANNNNSESGDRAFKTSLTLNESAAGIKAGVAGQQLNIYPNPALDYIALPDIQGKISVSVQLTDLTGNSIILPWQSRIDIRSLTPGMYIVRALGANGSVNGTGIFLKM